MQNYLAVPDPALPAVELLLDPDVLKSFLGPFDEFDLLSITNVRYKPETSCLVSYRFVVNNSETFLHAKAFQRSDWATRKLKIDNAIIVNDEHCFAVWQFPADPELPACVRLFCDREHFLKGLLPKKMATGGIRNIQVLAYKPNRRLVARLTTNDDSLVVKLHDKRTFKAALSAAKALKRASAIDAPKRVARSNRHRLLAYEWIEGEAIDLTGSEELVHARIESLIAWLQRFQCSIRPKKLKKLPFFPPRATVRQQAEYLSQISPKMSAVIETVADAILDHRPENFEPTLVHGDFHRNQVLFDGHRIRILDFDNLCVGTANHDIANFVAQLHFESATDPELIDVTKTVDEVCQQELNRNTSFDNSDFHLDVAVSMFRLSTQFFRSGDPDWQSKTWKWLEATQERVSRVSQIKRRETNSAKVAVPDAIVDAADPEFATNVLQSALPSVKRKFGDYYVNQVSMVRNKAGRRCLLEFELNTVKGRIKLLGKHRAKGIDQHSFAICKSLYRNFGFSRRSVDGISVPRTFGKYRPWDMWFQEKIDAKTVAEMMSTGQLSECVDQIAKAAFKLHQSSIDCAKRHSLDDELAVLNQQLTGAMRDNTELNLDLGSIMSSCELAAERIDRSHLATIHRDYYQDQLLIDDQRCWLIDLDLVSIGHPATDIGNFCAHLLEDGIRNYGDANYWDAERSAIMDRYLQLNTRCNKAELEIFQALSFVRHIAISWRIVERRSNLRKVLTEAHDQLNRVSNIKTPITRETGATT